MNMSSLEREKACFKTLRERGHFFLLELLQALKLEVVKKEMLRDRSRELDNLH